MSIFFRETIYSTILTTNIQTVKLKYLVTDILNIKKRICSLVIIHLVVL